MTLPTAFINRLQQILGNEGLLSDPSETWNYGYDNSRRHAAPELVALPANHDQVAAVVQLCYEFSIALTARGRGTGTTGASVPLQQGVILSTEKLNRICKIDPANRYMVVEPGVTNQQVQDAAAEHGFFWPPDPTSAAYCSVGGNLAYNSAGPRAIKYGTPRDNTFGLRAVTGEGKSIRTGVYTTKGVVGYDLTRLLIGSEGTLAIITEATLKLTPLPQTKRTVQSIYRDIDSAARAVSAIMAQPVVPYALEFMDGKAIAMIRDYSNADLPAGAGAMLMIEVDGSGASIQHELDAVCAAADNEGLLQLKRAETEQTIQALWQTRKALSPALRTIAPKKINEDVVVPVSNIPALINGLSALSEQYGITIVNFGHAGNGNIHVNLLANPDNKEEMQRAHQCLDDVFTLVLELDGTLSGEHGVGIEKQEFVGREIDPVTLELMRRIKQDFDPKGILNPGKMFPTDQEL
ncbi:FAD-binding oxidoreductase [Thiohalophilus sp.]|uniref:FAD-binding oxidoreductase n=1 Tax=Thiohalophilus sp. TaxID=3028392 RepID=UPI003974DB9F